MATDSRNADSQQPPLPPRPSLIKYIDEYRRNYYLIKARSTEGFSRMLDLLHQEIDRSRLQYSQLLGTMSIELPIPVSEDSTCAGEINAERHNTLVVLPNLLNGKDVFWAACHHEYNQELRAETFADGTSVCTIDKTGMVWLESFLTSVSRLKDHATLSWLLLSGSSLPIHRSCRLHLAQELMQRHGTSFWSQWSLDDRGIDMSTIAIDEARKLHELDPMNRVPHKQFPYVLPPENIERAYGSDGLNAAGSLKGRIVSSRPWKPMPRLVPSFEDMALRNEEHKLSRKDQVQAHSPVDAGPSRVNDRWGATTPLPKTSSFSKIAWGDIKEFVPKQRSDSSQARAKATVRDSSHPEVKKSQPSRYRGKAPSIQASMKNKNLRTDGVAHGQTSEKNDKPNPNGGNGTHSLS